MYITLTDDELAYADTLRAWGHSEDDVENEGYKRRRKLK